jgi:hypothetical protein
VSIYLDAHVHIYPIFSIDLLLGAALNNFDRQARLLEDTESRDYVLCLTEGAGFNVFSQLQRMADLPQDHNGNRSSPAAATWRYQTMSEPHCLIATNSEEECIHILAGRQLISRENLELLALGSQVYVPDKTFSLEALAGKVWDSGGIPVLPWGVGKWLGKRGAVIDHYISRKHDFPVVLGDNGNRPVFWPPPRQFLTAAQMNCSFISGSDPLPLAGHAQRVGTYGGWIAKHQLSARSPIEDLKALVTQPDCLSCFGKKTGAFQFFRDQLLVNHKKRLSRK